jgi:hypothetical protein
MFIIKSKDADGCSEKTVAFLENEKFPIRADQKKKKKLNYEGI